MIWSFSVIGSKKSVILSTYDFKILGISVEGKDYDKGYNDLTGETKKVIRKEVQNRR